MIKKVKEINKLKLSKNVIKYLEIYFRLLIYNMNRNSHNSVNYTFCI